MSSEKYEHKVYQNVIVRVIDFQDVLSNKTLRVGDSFGEMDEDGAIVANADTLVRGVGCDNNENGLQVKFRVQLNPPDNKPKKIEIKNINASLTSGAGYLFELSCSELFDSSIQFLDSLSTSTQYEEYMTKPIGSFNKTFILRRISGSNPLPLDEDGYREPYITNPSLGFTLIYHYYSLRE